MNNLKQTIREIRPSLRIVAPMTYYTILSYSIATIILCVNFQLVQREVPEMRVIGIFDIRMWAIIFASYSVFMLMFLSLNEWKMIKKLLIIGILLKVFFLLQLLSVAITNSSAIVLSSMITWSFFAYMQFLNYKYFTPKRENHD